MSTQAPIIIIGSHRSGTTWLGDVLSVHPDIAYWSEPRHVWTMGNAYRPDDLLTAADATPRLRARIRERLNRYVKRSGRPRLCEKTPSNCLRVGFVRAVLPEARIILLIRDGRAVVASTRRILDGAMPVSRVASRAFQTPLREWPAYAPAAVRLVRRRITQESTDYWGPRPPGWQTWLQEDDRDVVLARQWAATISRACDDLEGQAGVLRCRYEELMADPRGEMARIVDFLELARGETVIEEAEQTAEPGRADAWRAEFDEATLARLEPLMAPTLHRLGYPWLEPAGV